MGAGFGVGVASATVATPPAGMVITCPMLKRSGLDRVFERRMAVAETPCAVAMLLRVSPGLTVWRRDPVGAARALSVGGLVGDEVGALALEGTFNLAPTMMTSGFT